MSAGVLVWSEQPALERELLGKARLLADGAGHEVCACAAWRDHPRRTRRLRR